MAQFHCHWRKVIIYLCTPCICLALLFVYFTLSVIMSINSQTTSGSLESTHFVAPGTLRNKTSAALPKTFWDLKQNEDALWNRLQLPIDRHFNPILHPKNNTGEFKNSTSNESLLRQSFSELDLDSTQKIFKGLPQQMQEFVRHMQKRDYPINFEPHGRCGAGEKDEIGGPLLLLAIKTSEVNFKNRQAVRQTWGQTGWVTGQKKNSSQAVGGYVRRVFLLGKEDPEEVGVDISELLQMESKHYGDILQWDFKDTFFNLTLKDILFWSWFSRSCSQTVFVFKGDDDVFVNTPNMITYLHDQLKTQQANRTLHKFMVGEVIGAAVPNRVNKSKYFIPESFYKGFYPSYAGGGGVVYSGLLAKRLHNISKRVHLYPIDDVYVGMCMARLNTYPIHHPAFLTFDFPEKEENKPCSYHKILLVHKRDPSEIVRLWADMKKTQIKCLDMPLRVDNKKVINQPKPRDYPEEEF